MPAESKGSGFNSCLATIREMLSPAEWDALLTGVSEPTRQLILSPPMPVSWIKDDAWNDIIALLSRTVWRDQPAKFSELGRRQLLRDLGTLYRVLMRLVSPETVVKKAATIYNTYTRNGRMLAKQIAPNVVEVSVCDVENHLPELWHYHIGSITGTLECSGAKDVRVTIKEGGGLANSCVYIATWGAK